MRQKYQLGVWGLFWLLPLLLLNCASFHEETLSAIHFSAK